MKAYVSWFVCCAALLSVALLAGCHTVPEVQYITQVCTESEPERPSMPTDGRPWAGLDDWAAAAIAEIDRREAYEGRLRTALQNCKRQ